MKHLLLFVFLLSAFSLKAVPPPSSVYPFLDDFESYQPFGGSLASGGWSGGAQGFSSYANHGDNGSQGMTKNLNQFSTEDSIYTPQIGPLTNSSILSFDYRIVDFSLYPSFGTQLPADAELMVGIYNFGSGNITPLYTINAANHNTGNSFVSVQVNIGLDFPQYVGTSQIFVIRAKRGNSGDFFVDIDNFSVADGTPLALRTGLEKSGISIAPYSGGLSIYGNRSAEPLAFYDLSGRRMPVISLNAAGNYSTAGWAEGIYFARIGDETIKFFVKN